MISVISPDDLRVDPTHHGSLIDVRSAAEFATGHIRGTMNVPMEQVESRISDLGTGPVVLICEAGSRAGIVAKWLESRQPVSVLSGGTAAWRNAGLPLVTCAPCRWTLERQVRFTAGLIVFTATLLTVLVNVKWVYLAMVLGAGLTFAGATNICGMAVVLARMPWNRDGKPNATSVTHASARCHS